jgi:peroxidase
MHDDGGRWAHAFQQSSRTNQRASARLRRIRSIPRGDVRVNEQLGLIAIHTLLVWEHNRIAGFLSDDFLSANDKELYQMAQKLVTAEIQHITHTEILLILIGSYAPDIDAYSGYDHNINPGTSQEFSAVAFRVGHTFLSGYLLMHNGVSRTGSISLLNSFFDLAPVHEDPSLVNDILIGHTIQAANEADTKIIPEVRSFLFGAPVGGSGRSI